MSDQGRPRLKLIPESLQYGPGARNPNSIARSKPMCRCPYCNVQLRTDRLNTHITSRCSVVRTDKPPHVRHQKQLPKATSDSPKYLCPPVSWLLTGTDGFQNRPFGNPEPRGPRRPQPSVAEFVANATALPGDVEREEALRKQAARAARKRKKGIPEIVVGSIVTAKDLDTAVVSSFYLASDDQEYRHGRKEYLEAYEEVPHGADEWFHADAPLGRALVGSFVGDKVRFSAPGGDTLRYLILEVRMALVSGSEVAVERQPARLKQGTEDARPHGGIGSETYCFFARDNGQFGSPVSHDGYADEADAESNDNDWLDRCTVDRS